MCDHGHGAAPIGFDLICPLDQLTGLLHVAFDHFDVSDDMYKDLYGQVYPWMKLWLWATNLIVVADSTVEWKKSQSLETTRRPEMHISLRGPRISAIERHSGFESIRT